MKELIDKFSEHAKTYKKYRPKYPQALFDEIIALTKQMNTCWDCGTGNGQVAIELSKYFKKVYATDISQNQIDHAEKKENVIYKVERAESTSFNDSKFDLITVAQALHWFDFAAFNKEVKRVLKSGGIISVWGYGLLRVESPINKLIDEFYTDTLGTYWNEERKHVDNSYQSIKFDFEEIKLKQDKTININWNLLQLEGYFNSWSSVQNYKKKNSNENPVDLLINNIKAYWKEDEIKEASFPIFMRVGNVDK